MLYPLGEPRQRTAACPNKRIARHAFECPRIGIRPGTEGLAIGSPFYGLLTPAFGDARLKAADIAQHARITDSRPGAKFGLLGGCTNIGDLINDLLNSAVIIGHALVGQANGFSVSNSISQSNHAIHGIFEIIDHVRL